MSKLELSLKKQMIQKMLNLNGVRPRLKYTLECVDLPDSGNIGEWTPFYDLSGTTFLLCLFFPPGQGKIRPLEIMDTRFTAD